jgi:DNA segregation ATPase FtsK/SpoIIIE, S-DNA-T family
MTTITEPPRTTPAAPEPDPARKGGELRPILASWLKDRGEFTEKVAGTSKRAVHTTAWHVLHSPLHYARMARFAPRGAWKVGKSIWGWTFHAEVRPMQRAHAISNNTADWHKLEKERKEAVHRRWRGMAALIVLGLIITVLWWWLMPRWTLAHHGWGIPYVDQLPWWVLPEWALTPWWTFILICAASVFPFGYVGRPIDAPLIKRATDVSGSPPLRSETVVNALVSLRIAGMSKPEDIRLLHDISGPSSGYLFEMELPPGVTAESVMEKRPELSAALRHPLGTVWPSVGKRHQGHLVLFVSHEDMNTAKQKPWPLMKTGAVDVFSPVPLFTDQRNRWVKLTLAYTSGVIGAVPRMGKTFILRCLLLVGALDPRVKIYAFDLKGTGDLSPLRLVAHRYACTARPEKIAELLPIFEELQTELYRRAEVIEGLSYEECPENKVTPELASRRDLRLEPIEIGVDECHELFEHEDPTVAARFTRICTDLVKRGPALGIMLYLATQKPSAKSIPTAIADNAVIRVCLKVHNQISNDQVLGTGSSKMGLKAQLFAFEDKGIAYLKGEGADAQIVRSVFGLDAPASERVAVRARAARELEGRLTGDAAGEAMDREEEQVVLLDDIKQVFAGTAGMHLGDIASGLAQLRPAAWGSLDVNALGKHLRNMEVRVEKIHVPRKGTNAGVKREWLDVSTTRLAGDEESSSNVISLTERQ